MKSTSVATCVCTAAIGSGRCRQKGVLKSCSRPASRSDDSCFFVKRAPFPPSTLSTSAGTRVDSDALAYCIPSCIFLLSIVCVSVRPRRERILQPGRDGERRQGSCGRNCATGEDLTVSLTSQHHRIVIIRSSFLGAIGKAVLVRAWVDHIRGADSQSAVRY